MHLYLRKKRIISSTTHGEDESQNETFENTYQHMNWNFQKIRHHIGFNPL